MALLPFFSLFVKRLIFIAVFGISGLLASPQIHAQRIQGFNETENFSPRPDQLAKIRNAILSKLKFKLDIFNFDVDNILQLNGNIHGKVYPDPLRIGQFIREENLNLNSDLEFSANKPKYAQSLFSQRQKHQVRVYRTFPNETEARNLGRYPFFSWTALPYDAKQAKALSLYTKVRLSSSLTFRIGSSIAKSFGVLESRLGANYLVTGTFDIEIEKVAGNKIHLTLIGKKTRSKNLFFKTGIPSNIKIFSYKVINGVITDLVESSIDSKNNKGEVFIIKYLLNLENNLVSEAYNNFIQKAKWHKTYKNLLQAQFFNRRTHELISLQSLSTVKNGVLAHLKPIHQIIDKESLKEKPDAKRLYESEISFRKNQSSILVDFTLFKSFFQQNFQVLKVFYNNNKNKFLYGITGFNQSFSGRSPLKDAKNFTNHNFMAEFDIETKKVKNFLGLTVEFVQNESKRSKKDRRRIWRHLRRTLPESFHSEFNLDRTDSLDQKKNSRFRVLMQIRPKALMAISRLSDLEIYQSIHHFLFDILRPEAKLFTPYYGYTHGNDEPHLESGSTCNLKHFKFDYWYRSNCEDINQIFEIFHKIFHFVRTNQQQKIWAAFLKFEKNKLFKKIGYGLITRLAEASDIKWGPLGDHFGFISGVSLYSEDTFLLIPQQGRHSYWKEATVKGDPFEISEFHLLNQIRKNSIELSKYF